MKVLVTSFLPRIISEKQIISDCGLVNLLPVVAMWENMPQGLSAIKYSNKKPLLEILILNIKLCFCDSRFHLVGSFQSGKSTDSEHFAFCVAVFCAGKRLVLVCMGAQQSAA